MEIIAATTVKMVDDWLTSSNFYRTLRSADSGYIVDVAINSSSSGRDTYPMSKFELTYYTIVLDSTPVQQLDTIGAIITKDDATNMMHIDLWVVAKNDSIYYHLYGDAFGPVQDFYEMDSQEPISIDFNESDLAQFTNYIDERGHVLILRGETLYDAHGTRIK